jgi:ABC-2 type transport system permease protein
MIKTKRDDIIQAILILGIAAVVVFLSSFAYTKFDLTEEKRHTLTDATEVTLENLEDVVFVKVYLEGDFPAKYKRLERAVREKLDEFHDVSDGNVQYEFIDPYESDDRKTISDTEQLLYDRGLSFTMLYSEGQGVQEAFKIWPGALLTYKGEETAVQFLKSQNPDPTNEMINASVNNIEYELTSAISRVKRKEQPRVAFIEGHGELPEPEVEDFSRTLEEFYAVRRTKIDGDINALTKKVDGMPNRILNYEAIIIAKPDSLFSDKDKLIIDQYIMNGGSVMWLVDPIHADMDSLRQKMNFLGTTNETRLEDQLFHYGARLNRDIVIDRSCAMIALDGGPKGNMRNVQLYDWFYSPLVIPPDTAHPIVNNLDPVKMTFASSMDTVNASPHIRKIPLLTSSYYSRTMKAPVRVSTNIVGINPNFSENNNPHQLMGVLMEGNFTSNFSNRLPDTLLNDPEIAFRDSSKFARMVVISDGDVIRNGVKRTREGLMIQPLGYDEYAKRVIYDNSEFLMNCLNHMLNDESLIAVRSRSIELRNLDQEQIIAEKTMWQTINMALPILLVVLFGIVQFVIRKRRFT